MELCDAYSEYFSSKIEINTFLPYPNNFLLGLSFKCHVPGDSPFDLLREIYTIEALQKTHESSLLREAKATDNYPSQRGTRRKTGC